MPLSKRVDRKILRVELGNLIGNPKGVNLGSPTSNSLLSKNANLESRSANTAKFAFLFFHIHILLYFRFACTEFGVGSESKDPLRQSATQYGIRCYSRTAGRSGLTKNLRDRVQSCRNIDERRVINGYR